MKDSIKQFSINDIQEVATENSDEFFYARICALSTRPNSHKVLITDEILRRDGKTILGKWIVADPKYGESMSHTNSEVIVGIVPQDSNIEYIQDSDGYTSMYVDAILSKLYGKQVYDMFKSDNQRNVSVEMMTADLDEDEYGNTPIEGLKICGVTILGKFVNGSCSDANMIITQFSEESANKFYDNCNKDSLRKFAEERKEKLNLVSRPMDKKEYVTSDWNGDKAKHDAIKEKNFNTMAKSIFLKLDSDYKERKIGSLHYPVMGLYDGVWKYNSNGLSSARAYGEQHDPSVADKAIAIQKKLGLFNKEDKMADKEKKPNDNKEEDIIMEKKDKEMANDSATTEEMSDEKDKEMGCGKKGMSEDSKAIDETKDEKDKDKKEEKKFSLNTCADVSDIMAMLENETEDNQELAKKVMDMDAKGIIDTVMSFAKENADLKKYKADKQAEEKDKKLSQIMASIKEDIEPKKFSELQEEGKNLSINELGGFENKVKAFAYESSKGKEHKDDDGIMRFACNESIFEHKDNGSKLWN